MPARSTLLHQAQSLIPALSICSFDVFDTFLMRQCTAPDGVFELTWRLLCQRTGRALPRESFIQHRMQAEAKARRNAVESRNCFEVGIEEIYALFPLKLFGFERGQIAGLVEAEFDAELGLCRVNPEMAQVYETMQQAGVSTGFISDTYWSGERLRQLLSACRPGLTWDFLFASSDHGTGKAERLFARYVEARDVDVRSALHIGDNERADIDGAKSVNIRTIHYSQADPSLADIFQREEFVRNLICTQPHQSSRLDDGLRTMRRAVAKLMNTEDAARKLGQRVVGPIMTAFDCFVADRVRHLKSDRKKNVVVGFLARDGLLPHKLWQQLQGDRGHYLEINRRVSLMASAQDAKPLCDLFKNTPLVNARAVKDIIKHHTSRIDEYFDKLPHKIVSGAAFAEALPDLIQENEIAAFAEQVRHSLIAYLRCTIPDFDNCTDLVLVDLGYVATIQKALRRAFDLAGIRIRLHGTYLLTVDDATAEISDPDSAEGFISDLVIAPHSKRALLKNMAPFELLCASPEGSVRHYRDGAVVREEDPRPKGQTALSEAVQAGAQDFAALWPDAVGRHGIDPFADRDAAAAWCATILARFLMQPTAAELALFSAMKYDINLGTQAIVPLLDADAIYRQEVACGIGGTFNAKEMPAWFSASLIERSPLHGVLFTLFGAGALPGAMIADRKSGVLDIAIVSGTNATTVQIPLYGTAFGNIRLRIPAKPTMAISTIAIPLGRIAAAGRLIGAVIQWGPSVSEAMISANARRIATAAMTWIEVDHEDAGFSNAHPENSYLVIPVPQPPTASSVITIEFDVFEPAALTSPLETKARSAAA